MLLNADSNERLQKIYNKYHVTNVEVRGNSRVMFIDSIDFHDAELFDFHLFIVSRWIIASVCYDWQRCVEQRVSRAGTTDWVEVWVLVLAGLIGVGAAVAACTVCGLYSR